MAKKRVESTTLQTPTAKDTITMSNIIGGDDSSDFLFTFDSDVSNALPPEPLPENSYEGEITDIRTGINQMSGKPQLTLTVVVPPENFPADFSPDNAPDGVVLLYFSPEIGDDRKGRWNMRQVADKLKIPGTNRFRRDDFVGKRVKVEVTSYEHADGTMKNKIKGVPEAV